MAKKIYRKKRSLVFTFTEKSRIQSRKLAIENASNADPTTMATQLPVPRVPRKMHFSRREINEAAVFENQSKEHLFFSKFKHAFCEKPKNKKIIPKRVVKEVPFSS